MPLLIILVGLLLPRVTIVALWFLTNWFQGMFASWLLPALGFIFLPTSFLWYSAVQHWFGGQWDIIPIAGMVVAILLDLAPLRPRRRVVYVEET
ncbi:MAG TPA: hypothetical protein VK615_15805 [Candidatus Binatia bacterium]|nr:hypothetical protein [Candidatus Binatia bacterium]